MRDYTYQDMLRMQEEAANRVREMKKRAVITDDEDYQKPRPKNPVPDEVRHISFPVEIESVTQVTELPDTVIKENRHKPSPLAMLLRDKDSFLILALIVALYDTGADFVTLAMLVYLLM